MKKSIRKCLMMFSVLLFATLFVTSCSDDKDEPTIPSDSPAAKLIGSWFSRTSYETITMTFRANGTGTEVYEDEDGTEVENFTWSATEASVSIRYEGEDYDDTYSYSVSTDGNTLYLDGETYRKK